MLQKLCFCVDTVRERSGIWVHAGAYAIRPYETPCFYAETARKRSGIWVHAGAYAIRPYETPCFYAGADPGMLGGARKKDRNGLQQKSPDGEGLRLSRSGVKAR